MDSSKNECAAHPDREGTFFCSKYNRHLCTECLRCQDPNLFCKFRTGCLIWEISRHPEEYFEGRSEADL